MQPRIPAHPVERHTPFYDIHVNLGAKMIKGGGDFMFPLCYTDAKEEHINARTHVGMQDLSTMGDIDIKGPDALKLVNNLTVNDMRNLVPGQARYSSMCNEQGGIMDDITVYKFDDEHYLIVTSSSTRQKTARWVAEHAKGIRAYVTDTTAAIALPVVQGPRSRDLMKAAAQGIDFDSLHFFHFAKGRIGETDVMISRSGYTGELGYEVFTPAEEAHLVWDHIMRVGKDFNLKPYGVAAMHTMRLGKSLVLYGNDANENTTPFHCGLDKWIKFDSHEFVGRGALLKVKEQGAPVRWTGLTLSGDKPAAVKDKVMNGNDEVGHVTYSNIGHTVGATLAMAYIKTEHTKLGTQLDVIIGGFKTSAKVTPTPFLDPEGKRLRS